MDPTKSTAELKKLLSQFIGEPDTLFKLFKWLTEKLMILEAEQKAGAKKKFTASREILIWNCYSLK